MKNYVDTIEFGELMRIYRKRSGLTQEQAAERVGVSIRELSNIENNYYLPRVGNLVSLCLLYRIPVDQILTVINRITEDL